ncbi:hypothetical protein CsatB_007137 [Cannabis sativa]
MELLFHFLFGGIIIPFQHISLLHGPSPTNPNPRKLKINHCDHLLPLLRSIGLCKCRGSVARG